MKRPLSYSLIALLVIPLLGISAHAEPIVLYDNLDDPLIHPNSSPIPDGRVLKLGPDTPGGGAAQRFTAGESSIVTSVTMGIARLSEPGGKLIVSIREVDSSAFPGETVGILGEIEINGLSKVIWSNLPPKLELATVTGFVDGLDPGRDYFLVLEDQDAITDATRGWVAAAAPTPEGADPVLVDWGQGGWKRPWTDSHDFGPMHLHARIEGTPTYKLTIAATPNGTVTVDPEMATYPTGKEITVTAVPADGAEFVKWLNGEEESTENPYTITIESDTTVAAEFAPAEPMTVHYDNLGDSGFFDPDYPVGEQYRHVKFGPDTPGGGVAQMFIAAGSSTVTSVTLGLARLGEPGGQLIVSIRKVTDSDLPGESVGILGEIDLNSIRQIIWESLPPKLETVIVTGSVMGLSPGERYFLVLEDKDALSDANRGWVAAAAETPADADPVLADWGPGEWVRPWTGPSGDRPFGAMHLLARIEGLEIDPPVEIPIPRSDHGTVTIDPPMDAFPIGSEVTVTATPIEGYEFVKWIYGEEEVTTNPAVITVKEGATLAPVFARVVISEPLNIDIEPAVAISWDSQAGKTYEIHSSTDLENWTLAIDAIQGTGEKLTQCFLRLEMEVFYRVQETP